MVVKWDDKADKWSQIHTQISMIDKIGHAFNKLFKSNDPAASSGGRIISPAIRISKSLVLSEIKIFATLTI